MAQDAISLVNHLGWKTFHLVGVSMGGMISQEIALYCPERINSLTLIVTHNGSKHARAPTHGVRNLLKGILFARTSEQQIKAAMSTLYSDSTLNNTKNQDRFTRLYNHHKTRLANRIRPPLMGMYN